jgi:hypothetical protein
MRRREFITLLGGAAVSLPAAARARGPASPAIEGRSSASPDGYALAAAAGTPQVDRIDIIEYGTFTLERTIEGRDAQGINRATATNVAHAATTRTVPAQIGTTFGCRYKVVGKPEDEPVELRRIVVFPPPGLRPSASSKPVSRDESTLQTRIGQSNYMFYTFEDSFELVPGTWSMEMWHGNRKLATQSFTVVKPDGAVAKPDAGAARPDAGAAKPDAGVAKPGAGAAKPDAGVAKPGAGAAKPDAGAAKPGAGAAKPGAGAAKPGAGAVKPGGGAVKPDAGEGL